MPFLSISFKSLVMGTVTNGFPSVTSVLQHLAFKMSFHDGPFTAPSPSPGGDEKVIIFQRGSINYSIGLCIAKWSEVAQSCLTLCDPMDCSLQCSSVHGVFQARVLEWVAISFSRGSSQPSDQTWVSCMQSDTLPSKPPGKHIPWIKSSKGETISKIQGKPRMLKSWSFSRNSADQKGMAGYI